MLDVLGEAALRTVLLAGIIHCMLSLLHVRRARLLLATWTIVLVTSLTMPFFLRSSPLRVPLDDAVPRVLIDGAADLMQQPLAPGPVVNASIETQALPSIEAWLEALYVLVGGGLVFRALLGVGLSLRILARATPTCPEWAAGQRVRLSRDVAGPVTIAHTIVLPIDVVEWPTEMRRAVLAHESAHVARMDYAMLVMSQLNRAVFWFSPLSWWLHRRLGVLTELVSDEQAIEVSRDRVAYAEILLKMAQRSGPSARGPSMAKLSTLPLRIDRILLDQVTSDRVSRLQWATLTLGVAAVSLAVANVAPSIDLELLATNPSDLGILEATLQKSIQDGSFSILTPPDKTTEPKVSHDSSRLAVAPSIATIQPVRAAIQPRLAVQASMKSAINPSDARGTKARIVASSYRKRELLLNSNVAVQKKMRAETDNIQNTEIAAVTSDVDKVQNLHLRETTNSPLRLEVDRLNGSTCVGTVAIGMAAYFSNAFLPEPKVVPGQIVPAKAQFFQKADGSSWVRFRAFERPPLDLTVRSTRTGMTWTGEYGITYAVQETGGGRLVGLAARIANDSAALSFTCEKSSVL